MSVPTREQILTLLDRLDSCIADDLESQWLDFKPWNGPKDSMKVAVEYAVCFANADGGVVVFGVHDQKRGRAEAIHGATGYDIDVWKRSVFDATRPNLSVGVEELEVPEGTGKLLVLRVPRGLERPYGTAQGLFKQRVGKNCMPMDPHQFARTQAKTGAVDWSGELVKDVDQADLDPLEIERARRILRRIRPASELTKVDDEQLLVGLGAIRDGHVTRAGLLLFGREAVLIRHCPQHQLHYVHEVSETEVARNDSYRVGLLQIVEVIEQVFSGPTNPEHELSVGLFKLRIPAFPIDVVREAVLNALTHRDYTNENETLVRHAQRELTIHLNKSVAKDLLGRSSYTRFKGIDPIRYREMVREYVQQHGRITSQECRELLGLGESGTAKVEVSRLLKEWSGEAGFLKKIGTRGRGVYYLPSDSEPKLVDN